MRQGEALVVLSGGQDSTTCVFWAKSQFKTVHAITFDYGQRHKCEVEAAEQVARMAHLQSHSIVTLGNILESTSPLIDLQAQVGHYTSSDALPGGIEATFVPCRNTLFLTIAMNHAVALKCQTIVTGLSQEDYGGYPDCREEFLESLEETLNLGVLGAALPVRIEAPLLNLSKRETCLLAGRLGEECMAALAYSHTCYDGQYPPNPKNHASLLRARGFFQAGMADPLIVRAKKEGLLPSTYPDHGFVEAQL